MPALPNVVTEAGKEGVAVELPRSLSGFWKQGTELSVMAYGPEAAMLVRGAIPAGHLAGSLSTFSLTEIFGHLLSSILTGKLIVNAGNARRTVTLKDGQVVFASSTEPHERLGSVLVRLGLVSEAQLASALGQVKPGVKLGQVLTQTGLVSPSKLYAGMVYLVREIVVELFSITEGDFLFFEHKQVDEALKLQERTKDLVLEGIRRGEEVRRLRREVPVAQRVRLSPDATDVPEWLSAAAGGIEASALQAGFEGSEHAFLTALKEALAQGWLVADAPAEDAPQTEEEAMGEGRTAVELYGVLVRTICQALRRSGTNLDDLRAFLSEPTPGMEGAFEGVTLSDEGELDFARVQKNLSRTSRSAALARAQAYEAIDAFISYALFSARNALPAELAELLTREFRQIQQEHES